MQLTLSLDTAKIAEAAGHAVDDLDHWLSHNIGRIETDIVDLLGTHLATVDVKAENQAPAVDESVPKVIDHGATGAEATLSDQTAGALPEPGAGTTEAGSPAGATGV